jgi:hypothetical protein
MTLCSFEAGSSILTRSSMRIEITLDTKNLLYVFYRDGEAFYEIADQEKARVIIRNQLCASDV